MIKEHNDSTWQGKAYSEIVDTTQQVTSFPVVVRPMENTIPSWTIKGNMSQTGTPTPSSPIQPSETGERTAQLFDYQTGTPTAYKYLDENGTEVGTTELAPWYITDYIPVPDGVLSVTLSKIGGGVPAMCAYDASKNYIAGIRYNTGSAVTKVDITLTSSTPIRFIRFSYFLGNTGYDDLSTKMLNTGSTALPYQPYGYKLPIKTGSTTTPVYLGDVQSTRKIYKRILTGQEEWGISGGVFWTADVSPDYLRVYNTITYICSHYQSYKQHATASNTPDMHIAMGYNTAVQRIYLHDSRYTDTDDFKTYLAQQYAAGTPVTVWYVLAAETTSVVNEPLRKIGTYADSVSGTNLSVTAQSPTTIDVDTTLKPSEMDLTYTGMKMCKRKKRVNGAWV